VVLYALISSFLLSLWYRDRRVKPVSQILSRMVLRVVARSSSLLSMRKVMMPEVEGVGVRGMRGVGCVSRWGWHSGYAKVA
jgi:hypothetical protein